MKQIEMRFYTKEDFETVINLKLRKDDYEECKASLGLTDSKEILTKCLECSKYTWVGLYQGQIECVFGLGEQSETVGIPWFLSTDRFNDFKITFGKKSKQVIKTMLTLYPSLFNIVDSRNADSLCWLMWLGFSIDFNHPLSLRGESFYKFTLNIGD
jgi:hypothetical protein